MLIPISINFYSEQYQSTGNLFRILLVIDTDGPLIEMHLIKPNFIIFFNVITPQNIVEL